MGINPISGNLQPPSQVDRQVPTSQNTSVDVVKISRSSNTQETNLQQVEQTEQSSTANIQNDNQQLQEQVRELNELAQNIQRKISFTVDEDLGDTVIKVINPENDEVIRQIPSEELIILSKRLKSIYGDLSQGFSLSGVLLQKEV